MGQNDPSAWLTAGRDLNSGMAHPKKGLVREICRSLMTFQCGRKFGSRSRRTPYSAASVFVFVASCLSNLFALLVNPTPFVDFL